MCTTTSAHTSWIRKMQALMQLGPPQNKLRECIRGLRAMLSWVKSASTGVTWVCTSSNRTCETLFTHWKRAKRVHHAKSCATAFYADSTQFEVSCLRGKRY